MDRVDSARAAPLTADDAARARLARVAGFSILLLALLTGAQLWQLCRASATVPLWDEAAHGFAGVRVAEALRHLDLIAFLRAINDQVVWPFVHSLMLAPAYLVMGDGLAAMEAVSIALYVATAVLLMVAGTTMHSARGVWIGLLAATFALLSPQFGVFGTLGMLEMSGAFLLVLAFVLHARAAGEPLRRRRLAAAGCATTALFLCKYNYGLMWLIPLAAWEWGRLDDASRARGVAVLRMPLRVSWWLRPMPLGLALGALAIAAILLTGGGEITLLGRRMTFHSPGNLAYALWLALLLWLLVPRRARPSRATWVWRGSPERVRILLLTVALPLAIWFTIPWPNRVRELVGFVANRDSGVPLWKLDGLLFYPRAFVHDYSPSPWIGWAVLLLAFPWLGDRREAPARLAWQAFLFGFLATAFHRYRDSRFLFTVSPLLWLCSARNAVTLAAAVLDRLPRRRLQDLAWSLAAVAILASAWFLGPSSSDLAARRRPLRSPASVIAALDAVLETIAPHAIAPDAALASTEGARPASGQPRAGPSVLLGYSNVLSPALLAWRAHVARPEIPLAALPKRVPRFGAGEDAAAIEARLDWLDQHAGVVIGAIAEEAAPRLGPEYREEVRIERATLARLRAATRRWALASSQRVAGFRVERFERLP
jgi:hypothetical protein